MIFPHWIWSTFFPKVPRFKENLNFNWKFTSEAAGFPMEDMHSMFRHAKC